MNTARSLEDLAWWLCVAAALTNITAATAWYLQTHRPPSLNRVPHTKPSRTFLFMPLGRSERSHRGGRFGGPRILFLALYGPLSFPPKTGMVWPAERREIMDRPDPAQVQLLRDGDAETWRTFLAEQEPLILAVVAWSKWHFAPHIRDERGPGHTVRPSPRPSPPSAATRASPTS